VLYQSNLNSIPLLKLMTCWRFPFKFCLYRCKPCCEIVVTTSCNNRYINIFGSINDKDPFPSPPIFFAINAKHGLVLNMEAPMNHNLSK